MGLRKSWPPTHIMEPAILIPIFLEQYARAIQEYNMCPFREGDYGRALTPRMIAFNSAMSSVRVSVEWLFGDVTNYFRFIDFKKNLRIGMSAVGKQYIICALMRNALTCLYGNNTSQFFGVDPPSVEAYFA